VFGPRAGPIDKTYSSYRNASTALNSQTCSRFPHWCTRALLGLALPSRTSPLKAQVLLSAPFSRSVSRAAVLRGPVSRSRTSHFQVGKLIPYSYVPFSSWCGCHFEFVWNSHPLWS